MAEGPYLLGIDLEGTPIVFSERGFTLKHPRPGWAEQDPDAWWSSLEGAAAIEVIDGALPKLAGRGIIELEDFPLMRHLHFVVGLDEPLNMPWSTFFGGEPESRAGKG